MGSTVDIQFSTVIFFYYFPYKSNENLTNSISHTMSGHGMKMRSRPKRPMKSTEREMVTNAQVLSIKKNETLIHKHRSANVKMEKEIEKNKIVIHKHQNANVKMETEIEKNTLDICNRGGANAAMRAAINKKNPKERDTNEP